jgi:hypothetical protein
MRFRACQRKVEIDFSAAASSPSRGEIHSESPANPWFARLRTASTLVFLISMMPYAQAADLDQPNGAPRAIPGAPRVSGIDTRACRVIPQPQRDLSGNYSWYQPMMICQSRGIYADTFYPPY